MISVCFWSHGPKITLLICLGENSASPHMLSGLSVFLGREKSRGLNETNVNEMLFFLLTSELKTKTRLELVELHL